MIKWEKQCINGQWYSVATNCPHMPTIRWTKDGKYIVINRNRKAIVCDKFTDAEKVAKDVYKAFSKLNRKWVEE